MIFTKRFQFTLDRLKGYKEQILSKEKSSLAELRAEQARYAAQQAEVQADLKSLSEQIRELENKIKLQDEKIKFQTKVVVEANKDVSSLDKLEEKQREEYNFKAAKAEEQFIEEYVANSVYYKTAML